MDPTIFPEPNKFDPERWIRGGEELERYCVPFGKGSRRCIGMRYVYRLSKYQDLGKSIADCEIKVSLTWSYTPF
jgi:hypothetical protein